MARSILVAAVVGVLAVSDALEVVSPSEGLMVPADK